MKISNIITKSDAFEVSKFIKNENKKSPHMLEKTPDEIYTSANYNWWIKLTYDWKIIWFMWLYKFSNLYELWSLCIWEEFRNLWLWPITQKILMDTFIKLPIFLVTNVDKVKHISEKSWMYNINISDLPNSILLLIEEWWKLLSDDEFYFNKELFINQSFYSIINKKNES